MSEKVKLPDSTQLDTLNGKLESINTTLAGQEFVTKDNIVSALGYEPEKPEGNYELIETITLTEDVKTVTRTQEPDGTPYALNGIIIVGVCPAGTTQALFQGNMTTNKGRRETLWSATGSTASTVTYAHSIWEKWHGLWRRGRSTTWYPEDSFVQDAILYVRGLLNQAVEGEYISSLYFTGGAGISFRIYGRRYGGG